MENADDPANGLRDMYTGARLETDSLEIESEYAVLCEAFKKFDLSLLGEGTVNFFDSVISLTLSLYVSNSSFGWVISHSHFGWVDNYQCWAN